MKESASHHRISMIAGLGNPGKEYEATYHNVGMRALFFLAGSDAEWHTKRSFRYAKSGIRIFVVPRTFMNESGRAIQEALRYFKLTPDSLLVIHDDTDLPLGTWKPAFGRGAAGHHGVESIVQTLRTNGFWRARIGIRKGATKEKAGALVLKPIRTAEKKVLENVFKEIVAFTASQTET